ncbi:hypothetical protein [Mycobacteroides abscessus]|uniref:hypothetical protein n=1 Tax=Mycobacteroides abscessus TaxID=36809 RepID=UPI001D0C93EE|nr:hypothetical protein [Mycobacteroides abscessus]
MTRVGDDEQQWVPKRVTAAGQPGPNVSAAERVAVRFLLSDDEELDLHTAMVLAELVA